MFFIFHFNRLAGVNNKMEAPTNTNAEEQQKKVNKKMLRQKAKKRVAKKVKANTKHKKPKAPQPKKSTDGNEESEEGTLQVITKTARDFKSDLAEYLISWENREAAGVNWKFSKVLQTWALDHCFSPDLIDVELFKKLIPYIKTVQGQARSRLLSSAAELVEKFNAFEADAEQPSVDKKAFKRAAKIKQILSEA